MIWVLLVAHCDPLLGLPPVKLRPNISSSGGSNALGVVVLVMVSFEGSIS